jgi:anti-sigma-K factor RskA
VDRQIQELTWKSHRHRGDWWNSQPVWRQAGATRSPGAILRVSPVGVRRRDAPNSVVALATI